MNLAAYIEMIPKMMTEVKMLPMPKARQNMMLNMPSLHMISPNAYSEHSNQSNGPAERSDECR